MTEVKNSGVGRGQGLHPDNFLFTNAGRTVTIKSNPSAPRRVFCPAVLHPSAFSGTGVLPGHTDTVLSRRFFV